MTDLKDLENLDKLSKALQKQSSLADTIKKAYQYDFNETEKLRKAIAPSVDMLTDTKLAAVKAAHDNLSVADASNKYHNSFSGLSQLHNLGESINRFKDPYKSINKELGSLHDSISRNAVKDFSIVDPKISNSENIRSSLPTPLPIKSKETYAIERAREATEETNEKIRQLIELQIESNKTNEKENQRNRTLSVLTFWAVIAGIFLTGVIGMGTGWDNQNWQKSQEDILIEQTEIMKEMRDKLTASQ